MKTTDAILTEWEVVPCSRCGGSGTYSYCQMYGTTCFKCAGAKRVLTARGKAAMAWLKARRMTPISDLRPGMRIKLDGYPKPLTLQEVKQSGSYAQTSNGPIHYTDLLFANLSYGVLPGTSVEVVPEGEERLAQVRAAIAYQNTLTKSGKPRKLASVHVASR